MLARPFEACCQHKDVAVVKARGRHAQPISAEVSITLEVHEIWSCTLEKSGSQ